MSEDFIERARARGRLLYAGEEVAHRSCGIAIAETFGRKTAAYQALRRGGLTGHGECGAVVAGRLVLGELYGDPDPTGQTTEQLKRAIALYQALVEERLERREAAPSARTCNELTGQFAVFKSSERHMFCTGLAATVSEVVAEVISSESGELELPSLNDLAIRTENS